MTITASCGHVVDDTDDLIRIRFGDSTCDAVDGYVPCVVYASYCKECAERAKTFKMQYLEDDVPDEWWYSTGYHKWQNEGKR